MTLSVVIVNYNVKYFLKQCLGSVYASERTLRSGEEMRLEVWVVDNDSVDGSLSMVEEDYPEVHTIANHENVGFARANNQALKEASGDYLLLLNPDTVVERETLVRCVNFMERNRDCGGLCVKMVDGKGNFLRESKRGFPTPAASFYKIAGLARLFPHSRRFAAYYMGHLGEEDVNEVEIMPGAFLMMSRAAYSQIGGLDESYFMYGEDIDLSWRIHLAGFKNYYLPTTRIVHYKGESTKKGSMNYVYTFYNAMAIFVKKYFTGRNARLFNLLLQTAIWLRAGLAWGKRIAGRLAVPLVDFGVAYGGFVLLKRLWEMVKGVSGDYYPAEYIIWVVPLYILILMGSSWLQGGYDRPVRPMRIVRGMGIGLLLLLAFYSLLDESQRYSRMLLLLGSLWTVAGTLLVRLGLSLCNIEGYTLRTRRRGTIIIVGSEAETSRIRQLYSDIGFPQERLMTTTDSHGGHLRDLIRIEHAEEVVFCGSDLALSEIIELMAGLKTTGVEYKIAPQREDFIIGSESILTPNELYVAELDTISSDTSRRAKRMFDVGLALVLLLLSPVLIWFQRKKKRYYGDCLQVLTGRLTWVGYRGRHGIFAPADMLPGANEEIQERLMLRYMRHYNTSTDWRILLRNWRNI